jgi:hypothetical protein
MRHGLLNMEMTRAKMLDRKGYHCILYTFFFFLVERHLFLIPHRRNSLASKSSLRSITKQIDKDRTVADRLDDVIRKTLIHSTRRLARSFASGMAILEGLNNAHLLCWVIIRRVSKKAFQACVSERVFQ